MVLVGCSGNVMADRFTHAMLAGTVQYTFTTFLQHLWGKCAFLVNKIMNSYADALPVPNEFTYFKIHLNIIINRGYLLF